MNRDTYLKELEHYLKKLPAEDYENAMEYFTEYFDEAGPEKASISINSKTGDITVR